MKAIVDLGHSLNLQVTAEGVEDKGALDALVDMRCDLAQGYFIARPMPPEATAAWLKAAAAGSPPPRSHAAEEA